MNALVRETREVAVTGNETIEGSIASLREKMDRDHALLATNQVTLSDRIHQSHSTLSEKINSVHHVLRDKIEALGKSLGERIEVFNRELNDKIDTVNKDLGTRIDATNEKIDAASKSLGEKIDKNTVAIADMRGMLKAMVWVVGSAASAAAIVNIGKAFHWF